MLSPLHQMPHDSSSSIGSPDLLYPPAGTPAGPAWLPRPLVRLASLAADEMRAHAPYFSIIALYAVACVFAGQLSAGRVVVEISIVADTLLLLVSIAGTALFLLLTLRTAFVVRPPDGALLPALIEVYRAELFDPRHLVRLAVALLPMSVFMTTFSSFKRMIPFIHPFSWDSTFMEWDRWLHFGHQPWELLQPMLGFPLLTSLVNHIYHLWLFVLFLTLIWQSWTRRDDILRTQYQAGFLLVWMMLGTVLATTPSSGGPCYYGRLTGGVDPFAPLMAYLNAANQLHPVLALEVQETLWQSYLDPGGEIGRGISAMPSMHVATSVLMALMGWRVGRCVGLAYTVFAAVIVLGSVHLGWHYAIDGYVSIVAVLAIWWGAGRFARWWHAALDAEQRARA
ncbi:MAG: phosphoesterase PA-phosphatase [Myxococcales bacterium]|nr:MAG: phosphoesterase PA-phosphatase [Myxococcales bacterium]